MEIEQRVIAKIEKRRDVGRKKYGVTMERTDVDFQTWLQHAQDEALDFAIYLEKMIRMNEKPELHDAAPVKEETYGGWFWCAVCGRVHYNGLFCTK